MLQRDHILKLFLELSEGSLSGTRTELLDGLLHAAIDLGECDGSAVLLTHHRICERLMLRREDSRSESFEVPRSVSPLTRTLMRTGHAMAVADLLEDPMVGEEDRCPGVDAGPTLFVPLRFHEHTFGYLSVYRERTRNAFSAEERRAISVLAGWASIALQNLRLGESLKKLAVTDDLTQVYNFRFLKTALRREIRRAGRFSQRLALVFIDVDNLKTYNDRNGHLRGSFLLRELAGLFAQHVREFDLVAKYGGDEFTLILPQTDREGACAVAERMRSVVASHTFPLAQTGAITVSLGVAVFPDDATDPLGLIQASDRALYAAKKQGRNRVEGLEPKAA
jgi:diguanylate cyclase (GGDEF)-like protein